MTSAAVVLPIALALCPQAAFAANTENNVVNGQSDLTATTTYSGGTPTTASDVTFTNVTYAPTAFTLNTAGTNLSIGTLDDLDATQALSLQNTTSGSTSTITLNGGSNSVSGTAGDLLYVVSGGTLTISGGAGTLNLALAASGNFDIAGTANISSAISGAFNITKTGAGTLNLSGANTYSGTTTVSQGNLNLNFAGTGAPTTNIASTAAMTLGGAGGTLTLTGTAGAANTQTFASLAVVAGSNFINYVPGASGGTTGVTITAAVSPGYNSHGTLQFGTAGTTTLSGNLSSVLLTNGAGNAFATYGTNDWAATNASGQVIAATYTSASSGFTAGVNNTVTGSFTTTTANSPTSVRFADAAGDTVTVNSATLTTDGVLVASTAGVSALNGTDFFRPNAPSGDSNIDFNVIQNSASDFTIGANLANGTSGRSAALVKSGSGRLILTNTANGYTANTYIDAGVLSISNNGSLGAAATGAGVVLNGGNLEATSTLTLDNSGANIRPITLSAGGGGLFAASGTTLTVDGVISGAGALNVGGSYNTITATGNSATTINDNGTVVLSGANTYTGVTSLNGGTLALGNNLALQNSTLSTTTTNGGVLSATGFTTPTVGGLIGSTNLASVITSGYSSITSLTLNPGSGVSDNYLGGIADGATGMTLTKTGAGMQTLAGADSYTGTTTVSAGTLAITGTNSGAGSYSVASGAALTISSSGTVSASGVTLANSGTTTVNLNGGVLLVGSGGVTNGGTFNSANAALDFNGGTLKSAVATTVSAGLPINILAGGATIDSSGGNITFGSGLAFTTGSGNITIQGGNTVTTSVNATNETGNVTVTGTSTKLALNAASGNTSAGVLAINTGATVDMAKYTFTTGGLTGAGTLTDSSTSAVFSITGSGSNSFSGAITGSAALTMSGAGTQTLSGTNTYTGATTVSAGTLFVNGTVGSSGSPSGVVTVNSGGTLSGAGMLTLSSANVSGTLAPGATAGATTGALTLNSTSGVTLNGNLVIALGAGGGTTNNTGTFVTTTGGLTLSGATLTLSGTPVSGGVYDLVNYTGMLTASGTNEGFSSIVGPAGFTYSVVQGTTFTTSDIELDVTTSVPEPSTWAAGLICFGGVLVQQRRRLKGMLTGQWA